MALARAGLMNYQLRQIIDIKTFVTIKEKWGQIFTELLEEQDRTIN